jgi:hypothetical protein
MKLLLVTAGLVVAAAAGAAGAALFAPAPAPAVPPVEPARSLAPIGGGSAESEARIHALALEVADLEAKVRALESAAARTAVAPEVARVETVAAAPVTALQRDQILQVIADEKAAEERRREEERLRREEEARLRQADRAAQRYGLNEAQERQLADFYLASRTRMDEMRESMRLARESGTFDGEQMRSSMRDARDWATQELVRLFGPDLGAQIAEGEMERFRGGGFGFGGDEGGAQRVRRGGGGNGGGAALRGGGAGDGGPPGG